MNAEAAVTLRTKLVCTIGPASIGRVDALAAAGMDVARINFAHGTAASHREAAEAVAAHVDGHRGYGMNSSAISTSPPKRAWASAASRAVRS